MMMGYGMRPAYAAGYPGPNMYMMGGVGGPDSHMAASLAGRMPTPSPRTVSSDPNMMSVGPTSNVSSSLAQSAGSTLPPADAAAPRPFTAAPGAPAAAAAAAAAAASKSKQSLEKILDTLSKMFPDVRRSALVNNRGAPIMLWPIIGRPIIGAKNNLQIIGRLPIFLFQDVSSFNKSHIVTIVKSQWYVSNGTEFTE